MVNYIRDKQYMLDFGDNEGESLNIGEFYQFCIDYSMGYKVFGDGRKSNFDKDRKHLDINPTFKDECFTVAYEFVGNYANTNRGYVLTPHQQAVITDYFYGTHKDVIDTVVYKKLNRVFSDLETMLEDQGD